MDSPSFTPELDVALAPLFLTYPDLSVVGTSDTEGNWNLDLELHLLLVNVRWNPSTRTFVISKAGESPKSCTLASFQKDLSYLTYLLKDILVRSACSSLMQVASTRLPEISALRATSDARFPCYLRYYYTKSCKVYYIQFSTEDILRLIRSLLQDAKISYRGFHPAFHQAVDPGLNKSFTLEVNDNWIEHTKPLLDAYLYAKSLLDQIEVMASESKQEGYITEADAVVLSALNLY